MADKSDTRIICGEDLWLAFGLLTRLPLPQREWDARRLPARAAWAYPLVGAVLALFAGGIGAALLALGLPAGFAAAAILASLTVLTGAMHEDGLADSADGLWGGFDPARRLEIMKDSHIGAYGVLALIGSFALRWSALTALIGAGLLWTPLLAVALMSRAAMAGVMQALPHARDSGLSQMTGAPGTLATALACATAALFSVAILGLLALPLLLATAASATFCAKIARAKIGGQTGDILGATQQVTEVLLLATFCAIAL